MTETLKQTTIIKGTYVDRETLSEYEVIAGEGGVGIEISPRRGEKGEILVRLSFNSVGQYKNFKERTEVPQIPNE